LRLPTREERTRLKRAFDIWGVFDLFRDKTILISEEIPRKVCVLPPDAVEMALKCELTHAGLVIGELQKVFTPSMAGADLFARHAKKTDNYVKVGDNAEQLVLYGRDVMGDSITAASDALDENQLVIILNGNDEAIGVGRTRFAGKSLLTQGRITVTTLADAGQYLRDEG
jgi:predicted RNA-binding protein (TIGR00451 family)